MKIIDCSCAIGYKTVNYEVVNHENLRQREGEASAQCRGAAS